MFPDAPYPLRSRLDWMQRLVEYYSLTNVFFSSRGNSQLPTKEERRDAYRSLVPLHLDVVMASGNPLVLGEAANYGFRSLDLRTAPLGAYVQINHELLHHRSDNGRTLREAIRLDKPFPEGYVPPFIDITELVGI